jgi:hypothetical protein
MTDITVGQKVEYLLPENTTIGGNSLFEAEVIAVRENGTVDLQFLPLGFTSEPVVHTSVPQGVGFGAFTTIVPGESVVEGETP